MLKISAESPSYYRFLLYPGNLQRDAGSAGTARGA